MRLPHARILVAITLTALIGASPAFADTSTTESAKQRLREQNAKNAAFLKILRESDSLRAAADTELARIGGQLWEAQNRLAAARAAVADAAKKLAKVTAELAQARLELVGAKTQLGTRAAHLYIIGPAGYLSVILGASNINDAIAAETYGKTVLKSDSDAVDRMRAAEAAVRLKQEQAKALKRTRDTQAHAVEVETEALQQLHDRQRYLRASLDTNMASRAQELARLARSGNPFATVIAAFSQTGTGFTEVIDEAQKEQPPPQFVEGSLKRPVPGRSTSGFGWRVHPLFGYRSFHSGIDIQASSADPVYPASNGKVIDAGYFGPYGQTVLVDHGNHIATIYAHLSRIDVSPGDLLTTRNVLGLIGSTGWSTGPHLHFEVRMSGKPDSPEDWLVPRT